jgi:hypothetical protein
LQAETYDLIRHLRRLARAKLTFPNFLKHPHSRRDAAEVE